MYRLSVPRDKTDVLNVLDSLISYKRVEIPNIKTSRQVGMYLKPWRKNGLISLYVESEQKRTILVSNIDIGKNIRPGKRVEFIIDDSLLKTINVKVPYL